MRFSRLERHTPIDFNARRQAAFARKQQRERDRYRLFADHVAAEQHSSDEELARRQRRSDSLERTLRALHARVWRQTRSIYHSLSDDQRAEIRAKWQAWDIADEAAQKFPQSTRCRTVHSLAYCATPPEITRKLKIR